MCLYRCVCGCACTGQFTIAFQIVAPPSNDNFAARTWLPSNSTVTFAGTTLAASHEPGEPLQVYDMTASVWYTWTAPRNGTLSLVGTASFSIVSWVYVDASDSLAGLVLVSSAYCFSLTCGYAKVVAGTQYAIQIDGNYGGVGECVGACKW